VPPLFKLPSREPLEEGALLLRGFAEAEAQTLVEEVERVATAAPFRHLITPGGYTMSVAMTNCGRVGWVSDRSGYRYDPLDPETGIRWPTMPGAFFGLAQRAAAEAGFEKYDPDACLINRYIAGSKLSLHQDRDENDAWSPIVSVSLGVPAVFLWGGKRRADRRKRLRLGAIEEAAGVDDHDVGAIVPAGQLIALGTEMGEDPLGIDQRLGTAQADEGKARDWFVHSGGLGPAGNAARQRGVNGEDARECQRGRFDRVGHVAVESLGRLGYVVNSIGMVFQSSGLISVATVA